VLATVNDSIFRSRSGSTLSHCQPGFVFLVNTRNLLDWASCHWVAQRVHLNIDIRVLFLQFVNSIVSKLGFQQPIICCCMFCNLQHCYIQNPYFTIDILYFCRSCHFIMLLWWLQSAWYLDYQICQIYNSWSSDNAHSQDWPGYMSQLLLLVKASSTTQMKVCN